MLVKHTIEVVKYALQILLNAQIAQSFSGTTNLRLQSVEGSIHNHADRT